METQENLEQACIEYKVSPFANEALCKTHATDLKERFIDALGYCGRKTLSAARQIDEQEWLNAYFELISLYHKVK